MTIFENKTKITAFIDPIKESLYGKTEGMTKLEVIFEDAHNSGRHRDLLLQIINGEAENRSE